MTPKVYYLNDVDGSYSFDFKDGQNPVWRPMQNGKVPAAFRGGHSRPQSGSAGRDPHSKRWRFRAFSESNLRCISTDDGEVELFRPYPSDPRYDNWYRWKGSFFRHDNVPFAGDYPGSPGSSGQGLWAKMPDHTTALIKQLASQWTNDEVNYQETVGQLRSTIGTFTRLTRETARLLGNTVPTLIRAYRGPRKKRREWAHAEAKRLITSPLSEWRRYPALWLGWNFGIAPVARDAAAAVQRLTDVESRERGNPFWEVYMRKVLRDNKSVKGRRGPDIYVRPTWNLDFEDSFEQVTGVAMHFRIPRYVCGQYGGGQLSPLGTAWAFVPYSWLIDYVYPIGGWLQGMELAQIAPFFVEGSKSRKITQTRKYGSDFRCTSGWVVSKAKKPAVLVHQASDFRRQLMDGFPYTDIFRPPTVDLSLSIRQLSLGLSALVGVVSRIQSGWDTKG